MRDEATQEKAHAPVETPSGANSCGTKSGHASRLHESLWRRKRNLQRELAEVDEALIAINEDPAVQKVLKVLDVAGK